MPPPNSVEKQDRLSFFDKLGIILILIHLPIKILWSLLVKPFSAYGRAKSWKRIMVVTSLYHTLTKMSRRQARHFFKPTRAVYDEVVRKLGYPQAVDELGDDARLLWVGPKRTDRVLLYFHGGGFVLGLPEPAPWFWRAVQTNLEKRGKPTGLAILNYSLVPDRPFPAQLGQAVLAVHHLMGMGVEPGSIQLVGDSAGGALIHGVLSHMLHPLAGIPELKLCGPLGGAYFMSTWSTLVNDERNCLYTNDGRGDWLRGETCGYWGSICMEDVPGDVVPYLEGNSAPETWLCGVDQCVKRVLLSVGDVEVLRDAILEYAEMFKRYHSDTTVIVQDLGTHNDPYIDCITGANDADKLTAMILDWVDEGFAMAEG